MRRELRVRGISHVTVLYSTEQPKTAEGVRTPASVAFVPASAGLMIAGEVVRTLAKTKED